MFKQLLIQTGLQALLKLMESKPNSKFTKFLTSEKMQKTMADIFNHYDNLIDDWEATA